MIALFVVGICLHMSCEKTSVDRRECRMENDIEYLCADRNFWHQGTTENEYSANPAQFVLALPGAFGSRKGTQHLKKLIAPNPWKRQERKYVRHLDNAANCRK